MRPLVYPTSSFQDIDRRSHFHPCPGTQGLRSTRLRMPCFAWVEGLEDRYKGLSLVLKTHVLDFPSIQESLKCGVSVYLTFSFEYDLFAFSYE